MQEPATWRELLGRIIADPQVRQRIAHELGVSSVTLTRWVNKEFKPRPQNLRQLLNVLPEHRQAMLESILQEFEDFNTIAGENPAEDVEQEIPSVFYTRVMRTRATISRILRFSSICNLILQQALGQLDPQRLGMAIIVARCIPPSDKNKIRSLRESVGRGSTPWKADLEQEAILLGAESLAGYAVTSGHLVVNQDLKEGHGMFPAYRGIWEESAAAAPITFEGNIAGSLLVSSTQPNYFLPSRLNLITGYADLIGLAFGSEEFYEPRCIELGLVPPQDEQRSYLSRFRQRVANKLTQAAKSSQPINLIEAEQLVWQELEGELLQLAPRREKSPVEHNQGVAT